MDFSDVFKMLGINESARPEDLTKEKYFELYENMVKFYKKT